MQVKRTGYLFLQGTGSEKVSGWNPMNSMKRQKDMTLKDKLPRLVGVQYVTGGEWRNNSRKMESKQKQRPVVDVTGYGSKV